jgi:hypothetical protein
MATLRNLAIGLIRQAGYTRIAATIRKIRHTPVGGWWKDNNRKDRANLPVRYALLVSLRTDEVTTDIYTPIANQIGIPVAITT